MACSARCWRRPAHYLRLLRRAGLDPRQDATNADRAYTRNRVRHEIIPLLERGAAGLRRRTWRLAAEMAALNTALDQQLAATGRM